MKLICTIILILFSLNVEAADRMLSVNKYVAPTGNDANPGTIGSPYLTFGKAASVTVAGDSIIFSAGTYTQITQVIVAPGVSIRGAGAWAGGTRINLSYTVTGSNGYNQAAIQLVSAVLGTNGNQTISGIWFDGSNFACYNGILVRCRSNVIFSYCKFTNFNITAIAFNGKTINNTGQPPATFSTGNQVLNCSFYDCNDRITQAANSISAGSISYSGQSNLLFQYDTLKNINKPIGHNGNLFGAVQGNNKGVRWLNNIFQKPGDEGSTFNFGIESWYDQGGCEYAFNTYTGGGNSIDIGYGGANKGSDAYSWYIHDNLFTNPALLTSSPTQPVLSMAIQFESSTNIGLRPQNATVGDARIEYNYFKNVGIPVQIGLSNYSLDFIDNIYINHNVIENSGFFNNTYSGVFQFGLSNGVRINNVFVDNNTVVSNTGAGSSKGIMILQCDVGVISNIYFRNNIAMNALGYGYLVFRGADTCNRIFSQNNITYNNAFTNNPFYFPGTPMPTNFVFTNNPSDKVNPQFVSSTIPDYHLAPGSPAINGGINPPATYRGAYPAAVTNISPIANAGTNKNITLPTNFVTQVGSGTDADGTVVSYLWTRYSGPGTYTIASPTSATTNITNLIAGTYVFQLQVTDNLGFTGTDTATIVVNPTAPANVPPTASAGGNKTITLPVSTVTQVGSGTDTDGTIVSYSWAKTSGPSTFNIVSPTSATTVINNLVAGVYGFELTVTDNLGATGTSTATIIVLPAANVSPTADAGVNQTITWPTNSTTLTGSGNDPDGTIVAYSWIKIAGGAGTITNPSSSSTTVTGLTVGVYQFQLFVVDNVGATASDIMQVTVAQGSASINVTNLSKPFTGASQEPDIATTPPGLLTIRRYNGIATLPLNAGLYAYTVTNGDPNYTATAQGGVFTITKSAAVISASNATFNYDGLAHTITATVSPNVPGLTYTYSSGSAPVAIGVYTDTVRLVNSNYQATQVVVTITIVSNPAIIFISDTTKIYNGSPQNVTVTSLWPYSLTGSPQTNAGVYPNVTATINDGIHTGSSSATLTIAKRQAVLSWAQPQAKPYGSMLTTLDLNAVSDISGTWTYSKAVGTVLPIGVTQVTGTFVPTDGANNLGGTVSVYFSVFGVNPFLDYFISSNGKYFFIEQ